MDTKEVRTSVGIFVLKKPKAGTRNKAMIESESDLGHIKNTKFMFLLLPKCVQERPEGFDRDVPIDQVLDDLSTEDYDSLVDALTELIVPEKATDEKKTQSQDS